MRLIFHDDSEPLTYEQVYKGCQQGYGIKEPDKVHGFAGFFYGLKDIYAYGVVEKWIENNPKIESELKKFIARFYAGDYGFVTRNEHDCNIEQRWLCGTCSWTIGRYAFDDKEVSNAYGGIVLEFFQDYGLIYGVQEDMKEIYAKEHNDPSYRHDIVAIDPMNYRKRSFKLRCKKARR